MSGTQASAFDTMGADETALLDQMRADEMGDAGNGAPQQTPQAPDASADDDTGADDAGQQPGGDMVPHAKFHAMNERRKASETKARDLEKQLTEATARFEERLRLLGEAVQASQQMGQQPAQQQAVAEPEIPDVAVDPVGHFRALSERQAREMKELRDAVTQMATGQVQQSQVAQLRSWGMAQEAAYAQQQPAYADATNFLRQSRHAELEAMGIADPAAREQIIANDVTQIAAMARQNGANFAERLYRLAETRGFRPQTATAAADVEARAQTAQRGRDASMTLSQAGGAPATSVTNERVAAMSDQQFAAYLRKIENNPAALRELLGA